MSELITLWLAEAAPQGRGLAQGSPLSPLLANLYLDRLDETFSHRGARIVRFADDFVILTKSERDAEKALDQVVQLLKEHGLGLNREKTRITDFTRGFRFLGHLFVRSMVMKVAPEAADTGSVDKLLAKIGKEDVAEEERAFERNKELKKAEAQGYSPGLRNLYVMQRDRRLTIRNQAFAVEEMLGRCDPLAGAEPEWRELIAVPHQRIDRIDIGPQADATSQALDHALSTNTVLCFVDGYGATHGTLAQALAPRARLHLDQARTAIDDDRRLSLARILVEGRVRNQRALLRKLCRDREAVPATVTRAIAQMTGLIGRGDVSRLRNAPSVASVMGFEGASSAAYWPAVSALSHPGFAFSKRERERPDPANIALNFLTWLLHRDVSVAVSSAGLHPGFGSLHAVDDQRDACVYDVMEEFRGHLVEGLFVYVTNRRILRHTMFAREAGIWRLTRDGGDALIRAYESRAAGLITWPKKTPRTTFRRLIVRQARALAHHHLGKSTYRPFELDY